MKRLALSALLVASLAPAAHAQYGWDSMMNPAGMMNPSTMMMPMTMMGAPMMMGGMGNPMMGGMMNPSTMMMPMTMMGAPMMMGGMGNPMMGGMMNPSTMMMPMTMMGGMGGPQQYMSNPYLNPMGMANPYLMPQQPQGFFPMMPAAPTPSYGTPAYGYYPAMPQQAPFDPAQWMQMFSAPPQQAAPALQQ